jgi:hypothetical protein
MSDNHAAPVLASFSRASIEALTPAGRETFNAALAKAGFRSTLPYPTEIVSPAAAPAAGALNALTPGDRISADQARQGADALRKAWSGNPAALEHELAAAGVTAPERQPDAIYTAGGPADYRFRLPPGGDAATFADGGQAFAAAGVPIAVAQSLADTLSNSAARVRDMSPDQRAEHNRVTYERAEHLLGPGGFERALAVAKTFGPETFERWKAAGSFANVEAITFLVNVHGAVEARTAANTQRDALAKASKEGSAADIKTLAARPLAMQAN